MAPYKEALKNINDWAMHDPLALPALNQLVEGNQEDLKEAEERIR